MIRGKYKPKATDRDDDTDNPNYLGIASPKKKSNDKSSDAPVTETDRLVAQVEAGRHYVFEKPLPPDSLLRMTEDFSPIYEIAFRIGITAEQSRATLRTIERIHRQKMAEMANWTEAMRRAEAEKQRALKRIEDDMEVDQLRAQLKVMKLRMDDKSKELSDNAHFLQQVAALRANYEKEKGKQQDMIESPPRGGQSSSSGRGGGADDATRQSTGKKQKLYNALHYSALYDEDHRCLQHGQPHCPYCGGDMNNDSPARTGSSAGSPAHVMPTSNTPTPLKVHERYFQQRPAPALSYSPAKSQLNPLRSGPAGQQPTDVRTLGGSSSARSHDGASSGRGLGPQAPFGMTRKSAGA
ncbi:Hypothetical protein, putative [Bodo saltans]|uniref:Uncharacterized protein n=1 Tax=Bodo saltans TaxID=75058 RepID=A0A0S4IZ70_BODSA|nr:Hypothetical protein, putative [Bodo saltans]|eukprot:CUG18321.1 Hypothetical protein, putative [Bodo saltans]